MKPEATPARVKEAVKNYVESGIKRFLGHERETENTGLHFDDVVPIEMCLGLPFDAFAEALKGELYNAFQEQFRESIQGVIDIPLAGELSPLESRVIIYWFGKTAMNALKPEQVVTITEGLKKGFNPKEDNFEQDNFLATAELAQDVSENSKLFDTVICDI